MASNVNATYNKVRQSKRPWHWYHERLPKYLREYLANADFNWSDEQVYWMWKGTGGQPKRAPVDILALIEENEALVAYNWHPELKEIMK